MATKRHDKRPSESLAAERAAARYVKGLPDGWERKPPDEPPDEGVRAPAGLVESEHRRAPVLQSARDKFSAAARVVGQRPAQRLRWLLDIIERPREEIIAKLSRPSDLAFELSIFTGIADPQEFRLCLAEVISAIEAIERSLRALGQTKIWTIEFPGDVSGLVIHRSFQPRNIQRRVRQRSGAEAAYFDAGELAAKLFLRIDDIIAAEGQRVRECRSEACQHLFVKRRRADFCGERCALRERKRRYRAKLGNAKVNEREREYHNKSEGKS